MADVGQVTLRIVLSEDKQLEVMRFLASLAELDLDAGDGDLPGRIAYSWQSEACGLLEGLQEDGWLEAS